MNLTQHIKCLEGELRNAESIAADVRCDARTREFYAKRACKFRRALRKAKTALEQARAARARNA